MDTIFTYSIPLWISKISNLIDRDAIQYRPIRQYSIEATCWMHPLHEHCLCVVSFVKLEGSINFNISLHFPVNV